MVFSTIDPSATSHGNISVESVLRLRPLLKKEVEDSIVLEQVDNVIRNGPATVTLNPFHGASLTSPMAGGPRLRTESDATANNTPTEYHFNHVLPDSTSQDKIYYTLGLPIATAAMSSLRSGTQRSNKGPKTHVLLCMGVAGSGKTYTCFGGSSISKRRASQDGLVPRLVDSLFSQSKHHAGPSNGSKGFAVNISIAQVTHSKGLDPHACTIHDLLSSGGAQEKPKEKKTKRSLTVRGMAAKFERAVTSPIRSPLRTSVTELSEVDVENIELSVEGCADVTQAREILQKGLNNSSKAAKGQNHHLLITLQPVSNGSVLGDKIAILDMAGLEKGRKSQSRGKDSVANKNQEASAAVLHCLRTMIHNTNVRGGKTNPIDVADDTMSEISCVSQGKDPLQRQLKPVPFRQHKVTMLLQSLFTSSVSSKVTLLLAAYPGHADYYEKRILLQDMELLCGNALISCGSKVATGLNRSDSRSVASTGSRSTLIKSTSRDEDDSSDQGSVQSYKSRSSRFRNISPVSLTLTASIDEADEQVAQPPAYAPSFSKAREQFRTGPKPSAPPLASAPPLEAPEPMAPPMQSSGVKTHSKIPKNPNYVSDFPGVRLPAKKQLNDPVIERQRVTSTMASSNVGGRTANNSQRAVLAEHSESDLAKRRPVLDNETTRPKQFTYESKATRQPLVRSSRENGPSQGDTDKSFEAKKAITRQTPEVNHHSSSPKVLQVTSAPKVLQAISAPRQPDTRSDIERHSRSSATENSMPRRSSNEEHRRVAPVSIQNQSIREADPAHAKKQDRVANVASSSGQGASASRRQGRNDEPDQKVEELRRKMKELQRTKEAYERKCIDLEGENQRLKMTVKQAAALSKSKWTKEDEEQFIRSREHRQETQTLLKQPILSQLKRIDYIYDIKNQWCMTNKPHFDMKIPSNFQRAPELNVRDKEYEEREAQVVFGQENYAPPPQEIKKQPAPPPKVKPVKRRSSPIRKSNKFQALKKLTLNF
jgi:hypothetical protein